LFYSSYHFGQMDAFPDFRGNTQLRTSEILVGIPQELDSSLNASPPPMTHPYAGSESGTTVSTREAKNSSTAFFAPRHVGAP
jgi:hypothetical protein